MYATAPKTQLRPEPGTPGESGFGNSATLRINCSANETQRYHRPVRPDSLNQDVYGIEIEESLEGNVYENEDRE